MSNKSELNLLNLNLAILIGFSYLIDLKPLELILNLFYTGMIGIGFCSVFYLGYHLINTTNNKPYNESYRIIIMVNILSLCYLIIGILPSMNFNNFITNITYNIPYDVIIISYILTLIFIIFYMILYMYENITNEECIMAWFVFEFLFIVNILIYIL